MLAAPTVTAQNQLTAEALEGVWRVTKVVRADGGVNLNPQPGLTIFHRGYFTIVNETIDVHDGGVSGVRLGTIVEFAPGGSLHAEAAKGRLNTVGAPRAEMVHQLRNRRIGAVAVLRRQLAQS